MIEKEDVRLGLVVISSGCAALNGSDKKRGLECKNRCIGKYGVVIGFKEEDIFVFWGGENGWG